MSKDAKKPPAAPPASAASHLASLASHLADEEMPWPASYFGVRPKSGCCLSENASPHPTQRRRRGHAGGGGEQG